MGISLTTCTTSICMSLLRRFSSSLPLGDTEAPQEGFVDSIPYLPGIAHAQPPGCKSISLYTGSKQIAVMVRTAVISMPVLCTALSQSLAVACQA